MIKKMLLAILFTCILSSQSALAVAQKPVVEEKPALDAGQPAPIEKWIGTVTLTSGNLNIRKGPSTEDEIVGKLPNGSRVEVLEQMEEWVKIPYDESIAYVSKPYLVIQKEHVIPRGANNKVIVLDPGHGGRDPGAITKDGTYESDLVWQYTEKAQESLEKAGYIVYITRGKKSSCTPYIKIYEELECRAAFAKKVKGDIFISIHADSNKNKKLRGTITFYNARDDWDGNQNPYPEESRSLAQAIHSHIQPVIGSGDRGVHNKSYYVNRMNSVTSSLIELGFLSNTSDLKLLKKKEKQDKFAASLVQAVNHYFGT